MKKIRRNISEFDFVEKAYLYKPVKRKIYGSHDDVPYSLIIEESELPEGTPPTAPSNLNLIAWDEVLYLLWDLPTGAYNSQKIYIKDGTTLVDEIEIDSISLNELEIPENIINGTEYELYVSAVHDAGEEDSSSVFGTPENKTPQNVSATNGDQKLLVDWDDVTGDVKEYNVYVYEKVSGDQIQHIKGLQLSEVEIIGLTNDTTYEVEVSAVSEDDIFESKAGKVEGTPSEVPNAPENFSVEVQENTTSLSFDGEDDYVDLGDLSIADTTNNWTYSVRFKKPDDSFINYLFAEAYTAGSNFDDTRLVGIRQRDGFLELFVAEDPGINNGGNTHNVAGTTSVDDGEHHIASLTYNGDTLKLFLDFQLEAEVEINDLKSKITLDEAFLGALPQSGGTTVNLFWNGILDELQIWGSALSVSEQKKQANKILNGDEEGLVGYWNCEDQATDLTDLTSNNNHGTINGATYSEDTAWDKNAVCTWDEVQDVDGYNVYLSDDGGNTYTKQNISLISTPEYIIEDLLNGEYEAYVKADNKGVESDASNTEKFTI